MTRHELRRRLGLAWNALRHGEPVRVTITARHPPVEAQGRHAVTTDPEQLTADELRICVVAIGMWESEFNFGDRPDFWSKQFALIDKLRRMATALDGEEHQ